MELNVVYEDDALIVIDKPAGLVVHPGAGNPDRTLVNALIAHCGASLSGIGGVARPGIVHRLDKDTSGLLVVAKTDQAHQALSAQFADHGRTGALERGYLALVWGTPQRPRGTIDAPVGRHPTSRTKMAIVPESKGGREAVTHYEVVDTFGARRGEHGPEPIASLARMPARNRAHPPGARASRLDRDPADRRCRLRTRLQIEAPHSAPATATQSRNASTGKRLHAATAGVHASGDRQLTEI